MGAMKEAELMLRWFVLLTGYFYVCSTGLEEGCIWRGSGVPHSDRPSVVSMETTCHQGQLYWTDPFGGLRVTFNPRMRVHFDFKLCFTARHPGVRIYREQLESLTLLSEGSENVTKKAVCIKSKGEQLPVLYLETEENQTMTQVNYTVFVNGRKRPRHERIKECKPCRYSTLLKSLCKSEFAVRGYIHPMFPVGNGQNEQATIVATEVIRQENNIFVKRSETDDEFTASVKVPNGCHWKQMEKHLFLLTGELEAGKGPVLRCHIKEEIWVKLRKQNILDMCSMLQF